MTTDEKGGFIQIQNTIVSAKALVLVNCLNTFVHDCRNGISIRYCVANDIYNFSNNHRMKLILLERVSINCCKTKTKVITLANQKGRRQSSKPIKTRSNYT